MNSARWQDTKYTAICCISSTKSEVSEKVRKKRKRKKKTFKMALEITPQNKPNQGDKRPIC